MSMFIPGVVVVPVDKQEESDKNKETSSKEADKDLNAVQKFLNYVESPYASTAIDNLAKLQKMASTEKNISTTIGNRERGVGFESIHVQYDAGFTKYKKSEPVIREFHAFIETLTVSAVYKQTAKRILESLKLDEIDESCKHTISFSFASPKIGGTIDVAYFNIFQHAQGKWTVHTMTLKATFKTMPDWYIETTSRSSKGFLKTTSVTESKIVYVERGVTQSDMVDLLGISFPIFDAINNNKMIEPSSSVETL